MFSLSFKEIKFFKVRYLLIGFILFFVASLVFIISGLANGLSMDNASSIKNMNSTSFFVQKDSKERLDHSTFIMKNNDWKSFDKNVQPLGLQMTSLKKVKNDKKVDVTFMAINPDSYLNPEVIKGAKLSDGQQNEIVVDSSLEKEGVKIGDVLKDERTSTSFKVTGFTKKQTFGHTPVGFITLKTWNEFSKDTYNAFTIKTDNKKVENNFSKIVDGGKWVNKDKVVNGIPGYSAEQSSLNMMLVFLIIIATFVLGVFFYIMTIQKVSQFGILKAIGTNTSSLIFSTISQVFILSVISIAFAIGFTALMAHFMPDGVPFVFDTMLFLKYTGILIVVSLLGSLISTFNIVKADPIQSMGRVE